ncbi:MAG TPA: hypothetical protein VF756_02485 [Thermoanaerobaculia bacterium]
MSSNLSIAQMQAQLEARVAHHRDQEAVHAQQEVFHREQKAFHAAELQTAIERLESFQAAAAAAGEFVTRQSAATPAAGSDDGFVPGPNTGLSPLIAHVLQSKAPDETFGAADLAREITRRWGSKLRRRVDARSVAATLRRWAAAGRIHLVREGKAYAESLYTRGKPSST